MEMSSEVFEMENILMEADPLGQSKWPICIKIRLNFIQTGRNDIKSF